MLNAIWLALILGSVAYAAWFGDVQEVGREGLEGAKSAVELVIGLVGAMALFLGLMRVARDGGLLYWMTRAMAPILRRLFPDVPPDHPAMGAMVMNLASNALGLGNAATPFGLKAMVELQRLNPHPGSASNAMVLFLAINASSVALFPTGVIAVRASLGSATPDAIWLPTLIATGASTAAAITAALLLKELPWFRARATAAAGGDEPEPEPPEDDAPIELPRPPPKFEWSALAVVVGFFAIVGSGAAFRIRDSVTTEGAGLGAAMLGLLQGWFLPLFIATLLIFGLLGRVRVYEAAVEGAKEALDVAVRIVPFLVMILAALAMFRASGALDLVIGALAPVTNLLGIPGEAMPMAILRPLSGSGAYGVMFETLKTQGPDSFAGMLVSTLQGSTETTFYVLTIYLGAARIRDARHALPACLTGDLVGLLAATAACHAFFS